MSFNLVRRATSTYDDPTALLVAELRDSWTRAGLASGSEGPAVASAALAYLGQPYVMAEELVPHGIDCSTLTSQAHWVGAALTIPLTAERQRTAQSGSSVGEALPGDVLVKYPTAQFDGKEYHNHVALHLGADRTGREWCIEASTHAGVRIIPVHSFAPAIPPRRFLKAPLRAFHPERIRAVRAIAERVPKFGRFGVRQYLRDGGRWQHEGIDIYAEHGTRVRAPIAGDVTLGWDEREKNHRVVITNERRGVRVALQNVCPIVRSGSHVGKGEDLGELVRAARDSNVRYVPSYGDTHLHFVMERWVDDAWTAAEPLYSCKAGEIDVPLQFAA